MVFDQQYFLDTLLFLKLFWRLKCFWPFGTFAMHQRSPESQLSRRLPLKEHNTRCVSLGERPDFGFEVIIPPFAKFWITVRLLNFYRRVLLFVDYFGPLLCHLIIVCLSPFLIFLVFPPLLPKPKKFKNLQN